MITVSPIDHRYTICSHAILSISIDRFNCSRHPKIRHSRHGAVVAHIFGIFLPRACNL